MRLAMSGDQSDTAGICKAFARTEPSSMPEAVEAFSLAVRIYSDIGRMRHRDSYKNSVLEATKVLSRKERKADLAERRAHYLQREVTERGESKNICLMVGQHDETCTVYRFVDDIAYPTNEAYQAIGSGSPQVHNMILPTLPNRSAGLADAELLGYAMLGYQYATTSPGVGGIPDVRVFGTEPRIIDAHASAVLANAAGAHLAGLVREQAYRKATQATLAGDFASALAPLVRLGESPHAMQAYAEPLVAWHARREHPFYRRFTR
jgi:hypothetical protein